MDRNPCSRSTSSPKNNFVAFAVTLIAIWAVVLIYLLATSVAKDPVLKPPGHDPAIVQSLFPEGWAFFTRDPKEPETLAFRSVNGAWVNALAGANGDPEHAFGLRRYPRAQIAELNSITSQVPRDRWLPCRAQDHMQCLDAAPVAATLDSPATEKSLCGALGVLLRDRVPWAWAGRVSAHQMPAEVLRIEVKCGKH